MNVIITDLCVFDVEPTGLVLKELHPGVTVETFARTSCDFYVG